jgi:thiamine pyrophosphokinase
MPNLIIGDLDSVPSSLLEQYKQIPIEKHPQKKNLTDTELCIQKAIGMNPTQINLLAMTGNYFDHSYANIINLFRNYRQDIKMQIITSNSIIFPVIEKTTLFDLKGRRFSLFPLSPITEFSMTGAQYNFLKKNLAITDYSISNVIVADKLEINMQEGKLFCVLFDEGFQ